MLNKIISHILPHFPQKLIWQFSKTYIAGESTQDAIEASKALNQKKTMVTLDILGEFIENMDQAKANRDEYLNLIHTVEKEDVIGSYSLKPTMFDLLLDKEVCYTHIRDLVAKAAYYENFIRIGMENSPCVDDSIEIFRRLKKEFPKNVGLVLQAIRSGFTSPLESIGLGILPGG